MTTPTPTPDLPGSRQLWRSTLIAALVAGALLVTVVLPAEYGIDPTRVGRVLGLTQMGEIKVRLAREAAADEAADEAASEAEATADTIASPPTANSGKPAGVP